MLSYQRFCSWLFVYETFDLSGFLLPGLLLVRFLQLGFWFVRIFVLGFWFIGFIVIDLM